VIIGIWIIELYGPPYNSISFLLAVWHKTVLHASR